MCGALGPEDPRTPRIRALLSLTRAICEGEDALIIKVYRLGDVRSVELLQW